MKKIDLEKLLLDINQLICISQEVIKLPDTVVTGDVYKFHIKGTLEETGEEQGYLILLPNASIKKHFHYGEEEKYIVVFGKATEKQIEFKEKIYKDGESNSIDPVQEITLIRYHKERTDLKQQNIIEKNLKKYIKRK